MLRLMTPYDLSKLIDTDYAFRAQALRDFGTDPGMCDTLRKAMRDKYGED